ncbi:UPF0652 protein [Neolecta irregularis DAH-3]|uniref:UPF0652 protein n=1 Tax=Neolecta irregularis (strain DAH-3) TaxID=1198029 RepID=A0A1U7LM00_NEOID|nr:UPF0652 protein [Neolecta irregularis DAH-3]|eukprot:OLL23541.1 UPF0652 protein [Neolecta irregularis DAH-3]
MKRSLSDILSADPDKSESIIELVSDDFAGSPILSNNPKNCAECGDQEADLYCLQCDEQFCQVCCESLIHRTGKRKDHTFRPLKSPQINPVKDTEEPPNAEQPPNSEQSPNSETLEDINFPLVRQTPGSSTFGAWITDRSKYFPVRLTHDERKIMKLLEAALNVSEYTDKIDIFSYVAKSKRIIIQLKEMCSILSGLVVASDIKKGRELLLQKDFSENAAFFKRVFEIGRRYKIMNPDSLRSSYGKMVYMIQDSLIPEVEEALGFNLLIDVETVYSVLQKNNALAVLQDDLVVHAIKEIIPSGKSKSQVQHEIKQKERAIEILSNRYSSADFCAENIRQCLYSIGDNSSYLRANRDPVDRMIYYLTKYFHPENIEGQFGLGICSGRDGARLSHNHLKQYLYVNQSLNLWREIMNDMFKLWFLADEDLLSTTNRYRLMDTGQGLNRVQACPNVSRAMQKIIADTQRRAGTWIGSSVIHLGDHNVPNAFIFVDKYLHVPRLLNPVVLALESIDRISKDPFITGYIESAFESVSQLFKTILVDFFRHAFDGSGADSWFDAGSCIDGRLTSAWNWANMVSKKDYYSVFLMAGFSGFDGSGF